MFMCKIISVKKHKPLPIDNEFAKKLGAKWESSKKSWYILESNKSKELMMGRW